MDFGTKLFALIDHELKRKRKMNLNMIEFEIQIEVILTWRIESIM